MKKILIIQLRYLGEILFLTPMVRVLANAYPDAHIDWLVEQGSRELIVHHPLLHECIAIDSHGAEGRLGGYLKLLRRLRGERYDLILSFHRSEYVSLLVGLSGAARKSGSAAWWLRPWMQADATTRGQGTVHQAEILLDYAYAAGVPRSAHRGLELWVGPEAEAQADTLWRAAGLAEQPRVVGINPGGSWATKRWTVEGFAELCDLLTTDGMTPVLFGGPTDVAMAQAIAERTATPPVVFAGKLRLLELAAMTGKCTLFVSGDSGPLHLAVSQRVPCIALFGPTDPRQYAPYGVSARLVQGPVSCGLHPCTRKECPDSRCIRGIIAWQVLVAVLSLLDETASTPANSGG